MRHVSNEKDANTLTEQIDVLFHFFCEAKGTSEMTALLETLLTPSEKAAISQRLAIFRLLQKGKSYSEIQYYLKVAASTITRVSDLYHKHGAQNKLFSKQIERFKYQPEIIASPSTGPLLSSPHSPGARSLIRDNQRLK